MKSRDIRRVAIIGAGLMGHGIAQVFAQYQYQVTIQDVREKSIDQAFDRIDTNLQALVENKFLDRKIAKLIVKRIRGTTDLAEAVRNADFVVEAVTEDLGVKQKVFSELDDYCLDETILATNTSVLSVTKIGSVTERPEKVIGTHFWNPPHLVPAVEIVRGNETSDRTCEKTRRLVMSIGKRPVIVTGDVPGQIGIRILYAMLREAISLIDKGIASAEDIDTIVREALGTRLSVIGLLRMADLSGLDLVLAVSDKLYKDLDRSKEPSSLVESKVKRGEIGAKAGRGFYDWTAERIRSTTKKRDDYLIKTLQEARQSS